MPLTMDIGLKGTATTIVNKQNIALTMGSGDLEVFATPALVALLEEAACAAIAPCLESDTSSVGIKMTVSHDAATLMGETITATAELATIDGRKLVFNVSAVDEHGKIGSGVHERFIINKEKFITKLQNRM